MNPQYLSTDMLICCNKYLGKFISHSICFTIGIWEVFELFISTIAFFYLAPFPRIMASIPHLLWKGGRVFSKIPSNYFHSVLAQTKFFSIGSCFLTMYDFPAKNAVFWSRPTLIVGPEKKSCEDYETCFWRNFKDVHFDQKYELWARTLCTAER